MGTENKLEEQALRYNNAKLQWGLVDFESLEDMVKTLEFGAKKYSAWNWAKGMPTTQITESLLRHAFAFLKGENEDPESGISHLGHIQANAMFLSYILREKTEWDDRLKLKLKLKENDNR